MPATRGRRITRLRADDIAVRRFMVRRLYHLGYQPPQIAAAILDEPATAYLLEGQANMIQTVNDDMDVMRDAINVEMSKLAPLEELSSYSEQQVAMMTRAWQVVNDPQASPMERAAFARIYVEASKNKARASGIPVDTPAISFDLKTLILSSGGQIPGVIEGEARASGLVDAHTFAVSEDFCNLNLDDKPMQALILQEFMRPQSPFIELVDICGMRSGKGTVGSIIVWYMIYRLMELSNPQRYYGLAPNQEIGTINMAMAEKQAKDQVFKHIKDRLNTGGRWFQELRAHCVNSIQGFERMIAPPSLEIRLPKNVVARCGHSRAASKVGGTNICCVFDELCKYKTEGGIDNAQDVYSQIKASTANFGDDARICVLSSPEWEEDYGMQLLTMAEERDDMALELRCDSCRVRAERPDYEPSSSKSHPRMMAVHMATWEANTALTFEALWELQNGAANPRAFWRDFGSKATETEETYYPNPDRWDKQGNTLKVKGALLLRYPYDAEGVLAEWFKPCCDSRRFAHVDLGVTRDACGLAMAHKPVPGCPWHEKVDGKPNPAAKKVVVDVSMQIKPEVKPGASQRAEIDFSEIRDYIYEWAERGFKLKSGLITYDGWQSIDSRQTLRKRGFRTKEFSLDRDLKGHDTLQELINTDQLAYYPHPVLRKEGRQLRLKRGGKVDHPPRGSKDVVDAVAGCVYFAYRRGGRRVFVGDSATVEAKEERGEQENE